MTNKNIIKKFINIVLEVIIPDKIILFGSQAREDSKPDSDYDFLIIKSGIIDEIDISQTIYQKLAEIDLDFSADIIVVTPEYVEKYKNSIGNIIKPALMEGKIIYG